MLRHYRLALAPGQGEPEMVAQISLHPRDAVRLRIMPRTPGGCANPRGEPATASR
jgi:hypothetical protein